MTIDWNTSALIATVLATAITLGAMIRSNIRKFAQLELKVDIMWGAIMDRGIAGMVNTGIGSINSPLVINAEAKEWFNGMKTELKNIYIQNKNLNDYQLSLKIQEKLGSRILREICIPHKLNNFECLIIALEVAKSSDQ